MRLLLVILASIALGRSAIPNTNQRKRLEKNLGKNFDISVINRIVADEAKALGIPAQEHFQHCFHEEDAKRTKLSNEGFKEFMQKVGKMRFTSANKVMNEIKRKAPKAHAVFTRFYKETIESLDTEAAMFVVKLKENLIVMLYNHVKMARSPRRRRAMYGKALKKIFADYNALSVKAKEDFEKNTCFRTYLRILDATGKHKGKVTKIKNEIKYLMRLA